MYALDNLRIGFIGAGRLGTTLAWHCAARGLHVAAVASASPASALRCAQSIPNCEVLSAQEVANACDLVFMTTPDNAITEVTQSIQWHAKSLVVHCSGATEVAALEKAHQDGALIGGFHPLQAFGDPTIAIKTLPGSTITIEATSPLDHILITLAEKLGCHVNQIPPGTRALYHAAAGYTSQFMHVLFQEACDMWRTWGSDDEATVRALMALAQGTLATIRHGGLVSGMPGPVSRGDVGSVNKHLESLQRHNPDSVELYQALCERTVRIAESNHRINNETASQFRALLAQPPGHIDA